MVYEHGGLYIYLLNSSIGGVVEGRRGGAEMRAFPFAPLHVLSEGRGGLPTKGGWRVPPSLPTSKERVLPPPPPPPLCLLCHRPPLRRMETANASSSDDDERRRAKHHLYSPPPPDAK